MTGFDTPAALTDLSLSITPMQSSDRMGLTKAASDPLIWAQHPAPDRYKPEVFATYFDFLVAASGSVTLRDADRIIGCSRFYPVPDQADAIGIGFTFLVRDHWGGAMNRRLKRLMHMAAFGQVREVWYHIGPHNIRSQKATAKLGAVWAYDAELDLNGSHLPWKCYCLTAAAWHRNDEL